MKVQYSIASNKGIVVGTDHSAENITGFYTKYGDGADIAPLFGLNKRQGKQLLKYWVHQSIFMKKFLLLI